MSTIRHCWCKAGILPDTLSPPIPIHPTILILSLLNDTEVDLVIQAEHQLEGTLDELQSTGVLQQINWISINALLNSAAETKVTDTEAMVEKIYEAVKGAKKLKRAL
ncbi:hypothetical protein AX16_002298, partial [Volvariella volvacea WC 439]